MFICFDWKGRNAHNRYDETLKGERGTPRNILEGASLTEQKNKGVGLENCLKGENEDRLKHDFRVGF